MEIVKTVALASIPLDLGFKWFEKDHYLFVQFGRFALDYMMKLTLLEFTILEGFVVVSREFLDVLSSSINLNYCYESLHSESLGIMTRTKCYQRALETLKARDEKLYYTTEDHTSFSNGFCSNDNLPDVLNRFNLLKDETILKAAEVLQASSPSDQQTFSETLIFDVQLRASRLCRRSLADRITPFYSLRLNNTVFDNPLCPRANFTNQDP